MHRFDTVLILLLIDSWNCIERRQFENEKLGRACVGQGGDVTLDIVDDLLGIGLITVYEVVAAAPDDDQLIGVDLMILQVICDLLADIRDDEQIAAIA